MRYSSWSKEGTGNCSIGEIMMVIPAPTHPCCCMSSLVALHVVGSRREIIAFQYCEDQMDVIHNRSVMVLKSKMHTIRLKQWFSTWGGVWLFQWQSKSTRRSRKLWYHGSKSRRTRIHHFEHSSSKNVWRRIWYLCYSFTHRFCDHCISLGSLLRCSFNMF